MPDATHDAETDEIVAQLEQAGLVETYTDAEGRAAMRLTPKGVQVARSLALAGEGADVLEALLEGEG